MNREPNVGPSPTAPTGGTWTDTSLLSYPIRTRSGVLELTAYTAVDVATTAIAAPKAGLAHRCVGDAAGLSSCCASTPSKRSCCKAAKMNNPLALPSSAWLPALPGFGENVGP